ncbi:unnamed protein product [Penicillium salamii]|uniref:Erythromycin biosynthesis protein CIII-like C-terminal domain-containing protein n=1 Tax=Penicillium salamii TaxID=1612424 RepID=A0A9W4NF06_9EURO|nr:unnamed protein product [Penicillium salamii]CAG8180962.1 unnamed protein product [Penicillium salamii]CAG8292494.1 unnamed protein product [Penicillium salamii]CAG8357188.1 unnamed protein product [Penicillium salamii]CAG8368510.1 unnamed protein product [Penicillium salamii]
MASQSPLKKILLLTNVERGEANVFLATCDALLRLSPNLELHLATFGGLEDAVASVGQHVRESVPQAKPITFHKINGTSMEDSLRQYFVREKVPTRAGYPPNSYLERPGILNTVRAVRDTIPVFVPYNGPQMVEIFTSICDTIKKVDADLVVVDSLMTAGLTACYHLKIKFTCLSPNSIKDFAASVQPKAAGLWKVPALFSGYKFPVPWYRWPLNVYFNLNAVFAWGRDRNRKETEKHLTAKTGASLRTPMDLIMNRPEDLKILVSSLPELDFPLLMPDYILPCGPILRDASPIQESDPALEKWLSKGPTIYLNLGSICPITEDQALELALALKVVLDTLRVQPKAQNFQVLWKLKKLGNYPVSEPASPIGKVLGQYIKLDSVRIVDWIQVEPIAILQSGHAVCSIHHGGANSFNEAVRAGVPQVILPQWIDCYDYAERVEMLGIGRVGNRKAKPQWTARELSKELLRVLQGESALFMRQRANDLATLCDKNGIGAMVAAQTLLGECPEKLI